MAPRKKRPTPRKAAKPPVINLKASEVKPSAEKSSENLAKKAASSGSGGTTPKVAKPASQNKKPGNDGKANKSATAKPSLKSEKKSSRKGAVVIAALVGLAGAGIGGAWVYKEYGSRLFVAPANAGAEQLAAALARIDKLEKQLAATQKSIPAQPDLAPLTRQAADNSSKLKELGGEIGKIKAALSKPSENNGDKALAGAKLALQELTGKVGALENKLAALPKQSENKDTGALDALKAQLKEATLRLDANEANFAALQKQATELEAAQKELAGTTASKTALALTRSFTALRAKISSGAGFESELDNLAALLPGETQLDVLRGFSEKGAPTLASLISELKDAATSKIETPDTNQTSGQESFFGGFTKRLSGLVKVTRVDALDWDEVKQQAINLLEKGQLQQALDIVSGQKGEMPEGLKRWRKHAMGKLAIDKALQNISSTVMAALSAKTN